MSANEYSGSTAGMEIDTLYSIHKDLVYRTAYSVTGNRFDAEDAQHNVFKNLISHGTPDIHYNSSGYFYKAANEARKIVNSRARQIGLSEDEEPPPEPSTDVSPLQVNVREKMLEAIESLEDRDAELLLLRYEMGYTDAEIANLLGRSRTLIAVYLHRARGRLEAKMFGNTGGKV